MAPAKKSAAKKAPAKKKAAAKKAPAKKKAAAKKAPGKKKAAAKKAPAKKKAAAKKAPARKAAAPPAPPTTASEPPTAASEPPSSGAAPVQQQVGATVTSWNPTSGRGTVKVDEGDDELAFDVMKTDILNKGYVDFHVGQQVNAVVNPDAPEDESPLESLEAF